MRGNLVSTAHARKRFELATSDWSARRFGRMDTTDCGHTGFDCARALWALIRTLPPQSFRHLERRSRVVPQRHPKRSLLAAWRGPLELFGSDGLSRYSLMTIVE